ASPFHAVAPRAASAMLAALLAVSGCAVGPEFEQPAAPAAERYSAAATPAATAGDDPPPAPRLHAGLAIRDMRQPPYLPPALARRLHAGMDIPAQWWTLFRSPELDRMVREALAHSPTLEQARARLLQAQEEFRAESGARTLPSVDANLSGARQKVDPSAYGV